MPRKAPGNGVEFTSERQPSPENKKAGWKKKHEKLALKKLIDEYMRLPYAEVKKQLKDIKDHPDKYTMLQFSALTYVYKMIAKEKFMFDYRDRDEGKAPLSIQHKGQVEIDHFFSILDDIEEDEDKKPKS